MALALTALALVRPMLLPLGASKGPEQPMTPSPGWAP